MKDVGCLNRDLSKLIVMGHDATGFSAHPENFIQMREWTGQPDDRALEDSIDYLEMLAFSRMADVRAAAKYQAGKIFPDDFEREQAANFDAARSKHLESLARRNGNFLFRLFGLAKSATVLQKESPSYADKKLERIELRRREYAHIRELMLKQMQSEIQKEKDYYQEHKMSIWDLFSKGPPPAKPDSAAPLQP